jgi:hypothetical protein
MAFEPKQKAMLMYFQRSSKSCWKFDRNCVAIIVSSLASTCRHAEQGYRKSALFVAAFGRLTQGIKSSSGY